MKAPSRLLTFTTLYPNAASPNHGVFVGNRLRHLVASGEVQSTVPAPIPWFPLSARWAAASPLGPWARHARTPLARAAFPLPDRADLGLTTSPAGLFQSAHRTLGRTGFAIDAIDAHDLHPEGGVATRLGRHLGKPVVLTARDSDVSPLPRYRGPRRAILRSMHEAGALIAVRPGLPEAMACGTPVLASPAWGCREAVQAPEAGRVLVDFSVGAIVEGVRALFAALPDRAATRHYAGDFGWEDTPAGQLALFRRVNAQPC